MSDLKDAFAVLRKGLNDAYKHCSVEGGRCAICGAVGFPLAKHVIEVEFDQSAPYLADLLPMSRSFGNIHGSLPICEKCSPPCPECGLPTATRAVRKFMKDVRRQHDSTIYCINYGNGICKHVVLLGLFRL